MPVSKQVFISQLIERMRALTENDDLEFAHGEADALICSALRAEGGYDELLDLYNHAGKW